MLVLTYIAILILPLSYLILAARVRLSTLFKRSPARPEQTPAEKEPKKQLKTVMQPPRMDLAPPKDDPFTTEQLKEFDGTELSKPIYVAIKGWFVVVKLITPLLISLIRHGI